MAVISVEQAQSILASNALSNPITTIEHITIAQSLNRTLAMAVFAICKQPPFHCSMMDGFAFNASQARESNWQLPIVDTVSAGRGETDLPPNTAVSIATGAMLPRGADTVAMSEHCRIENGEVILTEIDCGNFVRKSGEEFERGATILPKGTQLRPNHIALLASQGIRQVAVLRKVRIAIVTCGDEVVESGGLAVGQIYNSNKYLLQALCYSASIEIVSIVHLADTVLATEKCLRQLDTQADIILCCGGVSAGKRDYIRRVVQKIGEQHFYQVRIKPGKPLLFASLQQSRCLCLPGNIGSAFTTFHLFVVPFLRNIYGFKAELLWRRAQIFGACSVLSSDRQQYIFGYWRDGRVQILEQQRSGSIFSIAQTQCLLQLLPDQSLKPNTIYPVLELAHSGLTM